MLLFVTPALPPARNAIGEYTAALAAALAAAGAPAGILTGNEPAAPVPGVPVWPRVIRWDDRGLLALVRLIAAIGPSTVLWQYNPFSFGQHGISVGYPFLPLLLRRVGIRTVVTAHETYFPWLRSGLRGLFLNPAQQAWFALVATTVEGCVTTYKLNTAVARRWRRPETVAQIPVGSNVPCVPVPAETRDALRARAGAGPRTFVAGSFGTFKSGQDTGLALRALAALPRSLDWRYMLIGDVEPGRRGRDLALATTLGIQDRVVWTGRLPPADLSAHLAALDAVLALYDDGASGRRTTLAAAFAHGRPVVTNAGEATGETYLAHGATCWMATPTPGGVCQALERLAAEPALRTHLAEGAARAFVAHLSWPVIAQRYGTFLERLQCRAPSPDQRWAR